MDNNRDMEMFGSKNNRNSYKTALGKNNIGFSFSGFYVPHHSLLIHGTDQRSFWIKIASQLSGSNSIVRYVYIFNQLFRFLHRSRYSEYHNQVPQFWEQSNVRCYMTAWYHRQLRRYVSCLSSLFWYFAFKADRRGCFKGNILSLNIMM